MNANQLINEKSPYLLQHAHNPVNWHAWTDEVFEKALAENKPVFLSIGYATCHWCHVMEKETFEDEEAADSLNDTFVCIKVDREERPDIDSVYMAACQMMTGSGGWPLTIFMTPDKKPFFAATYLPKRTRFGRAGVIELCRQVKDIWHNQNEKVQTSATNIAGHLSKAFEFKSADQPQVSLLDRAYSQIEQGFDSRFGGFEPSPKFPTPHRLLFLLRCYHRTANTRALEMVEKTLIAMRLGGIWDHVGFGFHRYSTDKEWLLPHFEKMLYDQALVALPYLEAYQITQNPFYAQTAREIFSYVLRDMQSEQGGFFSAEDADSEGEEGKFYVWTDEEFRQVLGAAAADWARVFNLKKNGNFHDESTGRQTGANILHLKRRPSRVAAEIGMTDAAFSQGWTDIRKKLFQVRKQRIHPLKDDKILTDWNGLMIAALARGGRVLNDDTYKKAAIQAARFILDTLHRDGRLFHRFREREVAIPGHASDYAFLIFGLLELYQATFNPTYLQDALALQQRMISDFWDDQQGGFFSTAGENLELPVRPKELYDGAIPSANSVTLFNLLCLSKLTGDARWEEKAHYQVRAFAGSLQTQPAAFTFFLMGLDFALNPGQDVVITGEPEAADTMELLSALNVNFTPNGVTLVKSNHTARQLANIAGYTDGLDLIEGRATAHICRGASCKESTNDVDAMLRQVLGTKTGSKGEKIDEG